MIHDLDLARLLLPAPTRDVRAEGVDALTREHDAFLAAIRGERAFPVSGEEGVEALVLVEAVLGAILGRS